MTTLQRSSISFRRQGSSGKVWETHNLDQKKSGPLNGFSGPLIQPNLKKDGPLSRQLSSGPLTYNGPPPPPVVKPFSKSQEFNPNKFEDIREESHRKMSNDDSIGSQRSTACSSHPPPPNLKLQDNANNEKNRKTRFFGCLGGCVGSDKS